MHIKYNDSETIVISPVTSFIKIWKTFNYAITPTERKSLNFVRTVSSAMV